jgi:hypothetical protein
MQLPDFAMLPPANNQHFLNNQYTSAIQYHRQAAANTYTVENHNNHHSQRQISASEDKENILCNDDNNE